MALTPDPDFATQVILRIHYQFYCYVNCRQEKITSILYNDDQAHFLDIVDTEVIVDSSADDWTS